ncbi:MAG: hypothetical protein JNJ84_09075 [Rhodobacteraceae bacterium]|nr:hypothetical protein [Paracoccaceae bacterium]
MAPGMQTPAQMARALRKPKGFRSLFGGAVAATAGNGSASQKQESENQQATFAARGFGDDGRLLFTDRLADATGMSSGAREKQSKSSRDFLHVIVPWNGDS